MFSLALSLFYDTWQPVVDEMALLKYFSVKNPPAPLPTKVPSLSVSEFQAANSSVQKIIEQKSISDRRGKYNHYTAEEGNDRQVRS